MVSTFWFSLVADCTFVLLGRTNWVSLYTIGKCASTGRGRDRLLASSSDAARVDENQRTDSAAMVGRGVQTNETVSGAIAARGKSPP
jgi:hypothetical protein